MKIGVIGLALGLAGCVAPPPSHPPDDPAAPKVGAVYLIDHGWHTDIALPMDVVTGPLNAFQRIVPGVHYLVFGFGERRYTEAEHKTPIDLVVALFPGPGIMLATALNAPPPDAFAGADIVAVPITQPELDRLSDFVWDSLEKGPNGLPVRIKNGPYPGGVFYSATSVYNGMYTCNTWTADALEVSGLPVDAGGVLFAHQVMDRAREAAAAEAPLQATASAQPPQSASRSDPK